MKKLFATLILIIALSLLIWQATTSVYRYNQPMEVVDIIKNNDGFYEYIIIENPPLSEKQFIRWWQEHQDSIKAQSDTPLIKDDGIFSISVWRLGEGFDINKEGEYKKDYGFFVEFYEQFCIDELPQEKRCLEKKNLYADIRRNSSGLYYIDFRAGGRYIHRGDGNFVESKNSQLSDAKKRLLTIFLLIFVLSLLLGRNIYDICRSNKQRKSSGN